MTTGDPAGRTVGTGLPPVSPEQLVSALRGAAGEGPWSEPGSRQVLVVELDSALEDGSLDAVALPDGSFPAIHAGLAVVVVGVGEGALDQHPLAPMCDVLAERDATTLDAVAETVAASPIAACALASLLRGAESRSLDDGLLAESAVYSALQGGPEFAAWRRSRRPRRRPADGAPVELSRTGEVLEITLSRPEVRNALNTAMRDGLVDALALAELDRSIAQVHLRGAGPSFCAGGDLDEFGSFPDPALAHLVRLQQSAGRMLAGLAERLTAHLHGACAGSGIELPAFAGTVIARPDTSISLPEVSLGLIPGAGGTVSLPRRIGRHRTARLALTGERIDAPTALAWGLVDEIEPTLPRASS